MNTKTVALTMEQYENIIVTMRDGFAGFRPNNRIATALVIEANLGLRIGDILNLKLNDIIRDGARYRLNIIEEKTEKERVFTVPLPIYQYIENYCLKNNIANNEIIFPITKRVVQFQLKKVCEYLGYSNISTHSFRKYYATQIYKNNDYDIALVQHLLQHSSASTTQKYIGIENKKVEQAILNHSNLL